MEIISAKFKCGLCGKSQSGYGGFFTHYFKGKKYQDVLICNSCKSKAHEIHAEVHKAFQDKIDKEFHRKLKKQFKLTGKVEFECKRCGSIKLGRRDRANKYCSPECFREDRGNILKGKRKVDA